MVKYIKLRDNFHLIINPANRYRSEINFAFTSGGAIFEEEKHKGLSHLMEHCILRETANHTRQEVDDMLFRKDIYRNASTGVTVMDMVLAGHKSDLDLMLEFILHFAFRPKISNDLLEQEKEIILREHDQRNGEPNFKLYKLIMKKIYDEGSRARCDILGDKEIIKAATVQDLMDIHSRMIKDSHFILNIVGGGVDIDKIKETIEPYLKELPLKANHTVDYDVPNKLFDFKYMPIVSKLAHDHSNITFAVPCTVNQANKPVRDFLAELFFSFPTGIFYTRLREELRLIYSLHYTYDESTQHLLIDMTTDIDLIYKLIDEVKDILSNFDEFFTEEKVNIIKDLYVKRQEMNSDNPYHPADFLSNSLMNWGNAVTYKQYLKNLKEISLDNVLTLYNEIKSNIDKSRIVVVSNKKEIVKLF